MANEISRVVDLASSGNYAVILDYTNMAYNVTLNNGTFVTRNHNHSNQKVQLTYPGSGYGSDEIQFANAPSALPTGEYNLEFFTSGADPLGRYDGWVYGTRPARVVSMATGTINSSTLWPNTITSGVLDSTAVNEITNSIVASSLGIDITAISNTLDNVQSSINDIDARTLAMDISLNVVSGLVISIDTEMIKLGSEYDWTTANGTVPTTIS